MGQHQREIRFPLKIPMFHLLILAFVSYFLINHEKLGVLLNQTADSCDYMVMWGCIDQKHSVEADQALKHYSGVLQVFRGLLTLRHCRFSFFFSILVENQGYFTFTLDNFEILEIEPWILSSTFKFWLKSLNETRSGIIKKKKN